MKKIILSFLLLIPLLSSNAQESTGTVRSAELHAMEPTVATLQPTADTLHLPVLNAWGQVPCVGRYPMSWGSLRNWQLHEGLNVSLGASVFASFGKNAYHSAGLQQNIALMYAMPLSDRLSLSIGGYFDHLSWGRNNYSDAGLNAVLGYRLNEQWVAYVYGQKSLTTDRRFMPMPLYDMSDIGDRIGAAIRYNVSPSVSIQVSVEHRSLPSTEVPMPIPRDNKWNQ